MHGPVIGQFSSDATLAGLSTFVLLSYLSSLFSVSVLHMYIYQPVMGQFSSDPSLAGSSTSDSQSHLGIMFYHN